MADINKRSLRTKFLDKMRTIFWYHNLCKITDMSSLPELLEHLSIVASVQKGDEFNEQYEHGTWKNYPKGKKVVSLKRVLFIDTIIPGSAESFLIGPNSIPLWLALSKQVNLSDSIDAWYSSFDWPTRIKEQYQLENQYISLEDYRERFQPIEKQTRPIELTFSPLTNLCRELKLQLPKVNFWHLFTRIILFYRKLYFFEVLEHYDNSRYSSWDEKDLFYNDDIPHKNHHFDDKPLSYLDEIYPEDWKYTLYVDEIIQKDEIKEQFYNLLLENKALIESYGLVAQDFHHLMSNLHNNFVFDLEFNARKSHPLWSKPLVEVINNEF